MQALGLEEGVVMAKPVSSLANPPGHGADSYRRTNQGDGYTCYPVSGLPLPRSPHKIRTAITPLAQTRATASHAIWPRRRRHFSPKLDFLRSSGMSADLPE